ncbi:RnfABCDGE type electron transport complex subunit D [Leptothermofonsia sp. ETS-13]|uniref:RnfABCDGE type electron transport complex subunit D n=1 Tax=Leptothermofonsia sp. ETS-13 TaxID=3035696 RepID=UPI003B9F5A59
MLLKDARFYQILFLGLFLMLGIGTRDWTLHLQMVGVMIATCLLTQWGMGWGIGCRSWRGWGQAMGDRPQTTERLGFSALPALTTSLPSALITSLGLSLLLRADHYSTVILAGMLAILSKFLLRVRGKHLFNPANFGIIAALVLTPDAWVSPGQWGEEGWYVLLFLGTGGVVLQKVGRWDTTVAFLGTYAGLEAIRNFWLGWTWDVWAHRLMSGSLLLFALFMITDPRTIPNARVGRLIWAVAIALLTFILRNVFFISTGIFWSLFALAPLTPLLDFIFPADRFSWSSFPPSGTNSKAVEVDTPPAPFTPLIS